MAEDKQAYGEQQVAQKSSLLLLRLLYNIMSPTLVSEQIAALPPQQ